MSGTAGEQLAQRFGVGHPHCRDLDRDVAPFARFPVAQERLTIKLCGETGAVTELAMRLTGERTASRAVDLAEKTEVVTERASSVRTSERPDLMGDESASDTEVISERAKLGEPPIAGEVDSFAGEDPGILLEEIVDPHFRHHQDLVASERGVADPDKQLSIEPHDLAAMAPRASAGVPARSEQWFVQPFEQEPDRTAAIEGVEQSEAVRPPGSPGGCGESLGPCQLSEVPRVDRAQQEEIVDTVARIPGHWFMPLSPCGASWSSQPDLGTAAPRTPWPGPCTNDQFPDESRALSLIISSRCEPWECDHPGLTGTASAHKYRV
jgi:hypothetical protein